MATIRRKLRYPPDHITNEHVPDTLADAIMRNVPDEPNTASAWLLHDDAPVSSCVDGHRNSPSTQPVEAFSSGVEAVPLRGRHLPVQPVNVSGLVLVHHAHTVCGVVEQPRRLQ